MTKQLNNLFFARIIASLVALMTIATMAIIVTPTSQANDTTRIVDGDLIKTATNPDIYIVKIKGAKSFKRLILNPTIFDSYGHLRWDNVKTVSLSTLNMYTTSSLVREINPDGSIKDERVFRLDPVPGGDTGVKRHVQLTAEQFLRIFDPDSIYGINHVEAGETFYRTGAPLTAADFPQLTQPAQPDQPSGDTGDGTKVVVVPDPDGGAQPAPDPGEEPTGTPADDDDNNTTTPGTEGDLRVTIKELTDVDLVAGGSTQVLSSEVEARDSDITIHRVDVSLKAAGNETPTNQQCETAECEHRPHRTFDRIQLLIDDEVAGTITNLDIDPISGNSKEFRYRFSGLSKVIEMNDKSKIEVAVRVRGGITSTRYFQMWDVALKTNAIRYADTLPQRGYAPTTFDEASDWQEFEIKSPDASLTLKAGTTSGSNAIKVSGSSKTLATLSELVLDNTGDVPLTVSSIPVAVTVSAESKVTGGLISNVLSSVSIYEGTTQLGIREITKAAANPLSPDNVYNIYLDEDLTIAADSDKTLLIRGEIRAIESGATAPTATTGTYILDTEITTQVGHGSQTSQQVRYYWNSRDNNAYTTDALTAVKKTLHEVTPSVTLVGDITSRTVFSGAGVENTFKVRIVPQGGDIYVSAKTPLCSGDAVSQPADRSDGAQSVSFLDLVTMQGGSVAPDTESGDSGTFVMTCLMEAVKDSGNNDVATENIGAGSVGDSTRYDAYLLKDGKAYTVVVRATTEVRATGQRGYVSVSLRGVNFVLSHQKTGSTAPYRYVEVDGVDSPTFLISK